MAAFRASVFAAWEGLGLAVQAYQKRALPVLNWLIDLSRAQGNRIPVRLVKGAYWDSESKRAQQLGLPGYPVYTRKGSTDVSYLACAKRMIDARDAIFPQFATHNAHSVAAILEVAGRRRDFEFQRLHGMGEALYHEVLHRADTQLPCRVYAPVGSHEDLLPYLVRRLLENGANTSFVHRLEDEQTPNKRRPQRQHRNRKQNTQTEASPAHSAAALHLSRPSQFRGAQSRRPYRARDARCRDGDRSGDGVACGAVSRGTHYAWRCEAGIRPERSPPRDRHGARGRRRDGRTRRRLRERGRGRVGPARCERTRSHPRARGGRVIAAKIHGLAQFGQGIDDGLAALADTQSHQLRAVLLE